MWNSARLCRALAGMLLAATLGTTLTTEAAATKRRTTRRRATAPVSSKHKAAKPAKPPEPVYTAEAVNGATPELPFTSASSGPDVLRVQVLLDRAHFSVGEIDGRHGTNTSRALAAFKKARGLPGGDSLDEATWAALARDNAPVVVPYTINDQDVAGPFFDVPEEMMDKAKLPALGYGSLLELLAERHHVAPRLLVALNQKSSPRSLPEGKALEGVAASFRQAGAQIVVPAVERPPLGKASRIVVNAKDLSVTALDQAGNVLSRYPATVGSQHDPLPEGEFKVNGVSWNPPFKYNPDLFWDAEPGDTKTMLKPGPNSPVGVVWVDLSKEHYGIHGTAEPASIGKSASHGCIRLTNWDAKELGQIVAPGVKATLER